MLIIYIFCVFVPILLTNVIFYNVTTENVKNQRMKDISYAIEQIKNEFRTKIYDALTVSSVFLADYTLNQILETNYENPADYVEAYDSYFRRILNNYTPVYNSVQNIKIYVDNPTLLHSGGLGDLTDDVKQSEWYRALNENSQTHLVFTRTSMEDSSTSNGALDTFSVVRRMNSYTSKDQYEKVLKIEMRTSSIEQIFQNLNLQGNIYLIDNQGIIQFTTDPGINWRTEFPDFQSIQFPSSSIQFETKYQYVNLLEGWRIVGTISEEEVLREVHKSRDFVFVLTCINILFPTLIILWITRSLNVRLVRILRHMKKVKNQNFDTIKEGESEEDEIGQLTGEFNRMTLQVKRLIDDVYVADIQKKTLELERRQAQLNALQSQINPHFLFNALETIRMRSVVKNETETAKIIHNMAKIFRTSLTWSKDRVTVSEEMEFIICFLEIQKYRFEDRLNYELNIDPSARNCVVPKMMFLPFVENASIHGIEPLKNGGRIDVHIKREADELVFAIRDNGIGMDEEKVKQIYGYLESEEEIGERIGVQNVIYRLKLIYGDRFQLLIDSAPMQGTYINLRIPVDGFRQNI